jgi:hypothetical protein
MDTFNQSDVVDLAKWRDALTKMLQSGEHGCRVKPLGAPWKAVGEVSCKPSGMVNQMARLSGLTNEYGTVVVGWYGESLSDTIATIDRCKELGYKVAFAVGVDHPPMRRSKGVLVPLRDGTIETSIYRDFDLTTNVIQAVAKKVDAFIPLWRWTAPHTWAAMAAGDSKRDEFDSEMAKRAMDAYANFIARQATISNPELPVLGVVETSVMAEADRTTWGAKYLPMWAPSGVSGIILNNVATKDIKYGRIPAIQGIREEIQKLRGEKVPVIIGPVIVPCAWFMHTDVNPKVEKLFNFKADLPKRKERMAINAKYFFEKADGGVIVYGGDGVESIADNVVNLP